jgi:hypothetical protein
MAHTPGPWFVGYSPEYDIDAGDDGQTIGYPTGRDEFDGTVFMVTDEDQVEIIAEHIRDEKTAHQIKAIPDMLEALEAMVEMVEMNGLGKRYALDLAASAIKKARGEK